MVARRIEALADRMLALLVPGLTARAECVVWQRTCWCIGGDGENSCTAYKQWCNRGCDSSTTKCDPCYWSAQYRCC